MANQRGRPKKRGEQRQKRGCVRCLTSHISWTALPICIWFGEIGSLEQKLWPTKEEERIFSSPLLSTLLLQNFSLVCDNLCSSEPISTNNIPLERYSNTLSNALKNMQIGWAFHEIWLVKHRTQLRFWRCSLRFFGRPLCLAITSVLLNRFWHVIRLFKENRTGFPTRYGMCKSVAPFKSYEPTKIETFFCAPTGAWRKSTQNVKAFLGFTSQQNLFSKKVSPIGAASHYEAIFLIFDLNFEKFFFFRCPVDIYFLAKLNFRIFSRTPCCPDGDEIVATL